MSLPAAASPVAPVMGCRRWSQQGRTTPSGSHRRALIFFFFNKCMYVCMYVFMAALGLCCCAQAFSSCGEQGLLFIAVRGLLIVVASLVAQHGL